MGVASHIARLRGQVGHDLLLLPSVTVLPLGTHGRVLLVRQMETGQWATVGGAVDVDETPAAAAHREAAEEIRTEVQLTGILGVVGGPDFRVTYPNGDQCAYVSTVYAARIVGNAPRPDQDEVDKLEWFTRDQLRGDTDLGPFAAATFRALGWLKPS